MSETTTHRPANDKRASIWTIEKDPSASVEPSGDMIQLLQQMVDGVSLHDFSDQG